MIVAGFGFRSEASLQSLQSALTEASGTYLPELLSTAADKADTAQFKRLAELQGLRAIGIPPHALKVQNVQTRSDASQQARGTGSVAEAAALAAAGPGAVLLGPRVISSDRMATCALAKGDTT